MYISRHLGKNSRVYAEYGIFLFPHVVNLIGKLVHNSVK